MMNVNVEECIGCGLCVNDCLPNDIELVEGKAKIHNKTCINCGHCIAICPKNAVSTDEYKMTDVKEYHKETFLVEDENLLNFIKFRRSVRKFRDVPVEEKHLSKIIEAGRYTQTGVNLQDVSYIVVREGLEELKGLAMESLSQLGGYILANLTPDTMMYKTYAEMWIKMNEAFKINPKENDKLFFNAPAIIIVTANSDVSGALASSNMELMTNALGLGTFFSGFLVRAAQDNKIIMDFLEVPAGKKIVTCMVIGHPDVNYLRTVPRKEAEVSWK